MITDIFLFDGLNQKEKSNIISLLPEEKAFKKGETIYDEESYFKALGILTAGSAAAYSNGFLKRTFVPCDVFGAAAVFGGTEYISRIISTGESRVLFIDESSLTDIFEKYPKTSLNYIAFLSDRIRFLNKKISQFSCKDAPSRLYRFLIDNSDNFGVCEIKSMAQLARLTGMRRTSLYRSVEELIKSGMIEKQGNIIKVV